MTSINTTTFEAFQASRRRVDRLGDHTRYVNDYEEDAPGLLYDAFDGANVVIEVLGGRDHYRLTLDRDVYEGTGPLFLAEIERKLFAWWLENTVDHAPSVDKYIITEGHARDEAAINLLRAALTARGVEPSQVHRSPHTGYCLVFRVPGDAALEVNVTWSAEGGDEYMYGIGWTRELSSHTDADMIAWVPFASTAAELLRLITSGAFQIDERARTR